MDDGTKDCIVIIVGTFILATIIFGAITVASGLTPEGRDVAAWNAWYDVNIDTFEDNIFYQVNEMRKVRGLQPVQRIDIQNSISVAECVAVNNISLEKFEPMLLDPDVRYIDLDVQRPGYLRFTSNHECHLTIAVW